MAIHVRTGYVAYVEAIACSCTSQRRELGSSRKLEKAIVTAAAHWSIYLTFWGQYVHWLDFMVVNQSDGVIEWKNGQPTREAPSGKADENRRDDGTGWLAGRKAGKLF